MLGGPGILNGQITMNGLGNAIAAVEQAVAATKAELDQVKAALDQITAELKTQHEILTRLEATINPPKTKPVNVVFGR
jgi:hypothetical protein